MISKKLLSEVFNKNVKLVEFENKDINIIFSDFNRHRYQHQILFTCSYCVFLPSGELLTKELKECKKRKKR